MKISWTPIALVLAVQLWAQTPGPVPAPGAPVKGAMGKHDVVFFRREMGKWWQNSEIVKKLQLSDAQIGQLDQTFYDHRMKLIDYGADMEKQDLKLQTLLDADVPDEGQVEAQVDQVLAARGKLEREFTSMNLDLRKVLSLEQWRKLKSVRRPEMGFGRVFTKRVQPGEIPVPPPDALPLAPDPF